MAKWSVRLPLQKNDLGYFFDTNNSLEEHIAHLLKNLIFTRKGEYCMEYDYGIGLQDTLFENITPNIKGQIATEIKLQIKKYIPQVIVNDIYVYDSVEYRRGSMLSVVNEYYSRFFGSEPLNDNELLISIIYNISGLNEETPKLLSLVINF